jgi:sulfatase maturation enzyme AslB (radical SAM superfamily)
MVQKINRTQRINQTKIISSLENIYISPLESCNLACKFCYTQKTTKILSNEQILDFVNKYSNYINKYYSLNLKSIILCGGEVFTLSGFPKLVNELIHKDIFVTIITNGTIDRINEINKPSNCQILVSLDGPKEIHDQNRGVGNFEKSIKYIKHAQNLGYSVGIMFLITKDSYIYKDSFPIYLSQELNLQPSKSLNITYLTDRKMSLTSDQCLDIKLHYPTFPAKDFGCFQLSLQSNGIITSCCESNKPLGKNTDNPKNYINNFIKSLLPCIKCQKCNGCSDSSYFCGYQKELSLSDCQNVVQLLTNI